MGQVGTFIGVGLMAAGMAWAGRNAFAKASHAAKARSSEQRR
jgi:hypothetical protein